MNEQYVLELIKGEDSIEVVLSDGGSLFYHRIANGPGEGMWRVKTFLGDLYYDDEDMANSLVHDLDIMDIL